VRRNARASPHHKKTREGDAPGREPKKIPCARAGTPARSLVVRPLVCSFFFLSLGTASAQWNVMLHEGRRHVPVEDVATFYQINAPVVEGSSFALTGGGRSIVGKAGGREVMINNVKYVLCFPIVAKNGNLFISAMDVTKIIEPVMRPGKIEHAAAVRTIVLDAGHGGHDAGASGPNAIEKEATLDVVLRAKKLLQENGFQVRLTRANDTFIPLEKRAAMANKFSNAIFVSVHFNKSRQVGGTGIETFALAPRGVPSMDEENLSYSDYVPHPGHARDAENIALATAMHSSMLRHLRLGDRGIKRARFVVIRDITIPGVLLEGGFVNHPVDSLQIARSGYRDSFARAILEGVQRYQKSVGGQVQYSRPSAEVTATDSTTAPVLKKEAAPVGSGTSLDPSVRQAAEAISIPPMKN